MKTVFIKAPASRKAHVFPLENIRQTCKASLLNSHGSPVPEQSGKRVHTEPDSIETGRLAPLLLKCRSIPEISEPEEKSLTPGISVPGDGKEEKL